MYNHLSIHIMHAFFAGAIIKLYMPCEKPLYLNE